MHAPDEVWDTLPQEMQKQIIDKKLKFYVIDAISIAEGLGLGSRINVIMQTAFFKISGIIPIDQAVKAIKDTINKTYGSKGEKVVNMNNAAVDAALDKVYQVNYPNKVTSKIKMPPVVPADAPQFVHDVTAEIMARRRRQTARKQIPCRWKIPDRQLPVMKSEISPSIFPPGSQMSVSSAADARLFVLTRTIRIKAYNAEYIQKAPKTFKSARCIGQGIYRYEIHRAGCPGRLHRLRQLRPDLSCGVKRMQTSSRQAKRR